MLQLYTMLHYMIYIFYVTLFDICFNYYLVMTLYDNFKFAQFLKYTTPESRKNKLNKGGI